MIKILMKGTEKLQSVDASTPALSRALPTLPIAETTVVRLIRIAAHGLSEHFQHVFLKHGLNENSYHLLCLLHASTDGQAFPSELSDLTGTSRANMTRILAKLESDGYISRHTGKADARRSLIILTDSGRTIINTTTPKVVGPISDAFAKLSNSEMETLDKLLRKAIVSFDEARQNAKF